MNYFLIKKCLIFFKLDNCLNTLLKLIINDYEKFLLNGEL